MYAATIRLLNAEEITVNICKNGGYVHLVDSTAQQLAVQIHPELMFNIESFSFKADRISCEHAVISNVNVDQLLFSLNNTKIPELQLKLRTQSDLSVVCPALVTEGTVRVSPRGYHLALPEHGIIYGDLVVPFRMTIPKNLCCLGSVSYYE